MNEEKEDLKLKSNPRAAVVQQLPRHLQPPPKAGAAKAKQDYSALIKEYEAELDDVHPNWRSANAMARQYHNLEKEVAERICWLINRLDRLRRGIDCPVQVLWSPSGMPFGIAHKPDRGRR